MIRLFMRYVLGGESTKRELPIFAFLWFGGMLTYALLTEMSDTAINVLAWLTAAALGVGGTTTTMHHLHPPAPAAQPGQDGQVGYPAGDYPYERETATSGRPVAELRE